MLPSMLIMTWTMHILCMLKFSDYLSNSVIILLQKSRIQGRKKVWKSEGASTDVEA